MEEKEKLVEKWLKNELTEAELKSFMSTDDFTAFQKIDDAAQHFKAPAFDTTASYNAISLAPKTVRKASLVLYIGTIAAILIIAICLFQFLGNPTNTTYFADIGNKQTLVLPDNSSVTLNASSTLILNEKNWDRSLQLEGEAYFKVAKGETFSVQTKQGLVQVLGTQFTVKDRPDVFEVICYEGLVSVHYNEKEYKVPVGTRFSVENGNVLQQGIAAISPSWINGLSIFKSSTLDQVLKELERQYNIVLVIHNVDKTILFTGSFTHDNLESALQSIAIPLTLDYQIKENKVTLTKQ